jgi:hypothetical protein
MHSHSPSAQTQRRRNWPEAERAFMQTDMAAPGANISHVSRRFIVIPFIYHNLLIQ